MAGRVNASPPQRGRVEISHRLLGRIAAHICTAPDEFLAGPKCDVERDQLRVRAAEASCPGKKLLFDLVPQDHHAVLVLNGGLTLPVRPLRRPCSLLGEQGDEPLWRAGRVGLPRSRVLHGQWIGHTGGTHPPRDHVDLHLHHVRRRRRAQTAIRPLLRIRFRLRHYRSSPFAVAMDTACSARRLADLRPRADSRWSTPNRASRSRCSTTITAALGSARTRCSLRRLPFRPEPISLTTSLTARPAAFAPSTTRMACRSRPPL
ncbi:hypothetical protein SAMN05421811_107306 [Nonomuraea wenchangensis]|uniref:Uncharacterized protein n=1 Tax=Nonomuraea wenchangensis TaxID=568860 RepID=A0A1I0KAQ6_9ACTN|nr:hypothetical protein SAMN05421811_107306 [Nonomuraea wenchangensis]